MCMHCCVDQMGGGKVKKPGKRGRKPAKIDLKAKLERSRQSARECRARKKLRYQYLEELVSSKERAICALREELEMVHQLLINILILDDNNSINNWLKFARRTKVNVSTKKNVQYFYCSCFCLSTVQTVVFGYGPRQNPVRNQSSSDRRRAENHSKWRKQQQDVQEQKQHQLQRSELDRWPLHRLKGKTLTLREDDDQALELQSSTHFIFLQL